MSITTEQREQYRAFMRAEYACGLGTMPRRRRFVARRFQKLSDQDLDNLRAWYLNPHKQGRPYGFDFVSWLMIASLVINLLRLWFTTKEPQR